jgi:hypothetical protein
MFVVFFDIMLASVICSLPSKLNDLSLVQCIEIVINPVSVMYLHHVRDSDLSRPLQCSAIDCNVRSVTCKSGCSESPISINSKHGQ